VGSGFCCRGEICRNREEGRRKKEEGRRKKEEGRRKKEEGRTADREEEANHDKGGNYLKS
jgi:hypothetical protein